MYSSWRAVSELQRLSAIFRTEIWRWTASPCLENGGACCPPNSICYSDGICLSETDEIVQRHSCTSRSWDDPNCATFCVDGDYTNMALEVECVTDNNQRCGLTALNTFKFVIPFRTATVHAAQFKACHKAAVGWIGSNSSRSVTPTLSQWFEARRLPHQHPCHSQVRHRLRPRIPEVYIISSSWISDSGLTYYSIHDVGV